MRVLSLDPRKKGSKATEGAGGSLKLEAGSMSSVEEANGVAVVSTWMKGPVASLSLSHYLQELDRAGLTPLVVDASSFAEEIQWPHGLPEDAVVFRRVNVGYDFGSWAAALHAYPQVATKDRVLLTNDSMVGPFSTMQAVFVEEQRSAADIFALADSYQGAHHAQSYFLLFRGGILADPPWAAFFQGVRQQEDKEEIVAAYEFGVAQVASAYGYSWEAMVPAGSLGLRDANPTLSAWKRMLDSGVPMVKRSILTDPAHAVTAQAMADAVAIEFGENVEDWLPYGYRESLSGVMDGGRGNSHPQLLKVTNGSTDR